MRKLLLFFSMLFLGIINAQQTAIPDPFFEQILIDKEIDSDGIVNGLTLTSDISQIINFTIIDNNSSLFSLDGIQGFTSLTNLVINGFPNLHTLDFSGNVNLKKLNINYTYLTSLNVSNNLLLDSFQGNWINFPLNIDLSNNINLEEIALNGSWLTNLDVSSNVNLKHLNLYGNSLNTINISNNSILETLDLGNNNLENIDISTNPLLNDLYIENNALLNLNIENNSLLDLLVCSNNNLYSLNLDNNTNLDKIFCGDNDNLTILSIQNGNNILLNGTYLDYDGNYYNRFNSTNCPNLQCIYVDNISNSETNWLGIDATSHFVTTQQECELLSNNQFISQSNVNFYPNPVENILNFSNDEEIKKVEIYDLLGKKIHEKNRNFSQLDVTKLEKGVYLVKIMTKKGDFFTEKVIRK